MIPTEIRIDFSKVLPAELSMRIMADVANSGDLASRCVNRCFKGLFDNSLWDHWEQVNQIPSRGPEDIRSLQERIEQSSPENCCFRLFKELAKTFVRQGAVLSPHFLPTTSAHFQHLQNQLQAIYETQALIAIWPKIQSQLHLPNLPLTAAEIRAWINDPNHAHLLNGITDLVLSDLQLKVLPPEIGKFTALAHLSLYNNQLRVLNESISNLTALKWLHLSNNQLEALPESIGSLTALTGLWLSNNQLEALPKSVGNLVALTRLILHNNQLRELPEFVGNLTALTDLNLSNNKLRELPVSLGNLTVLRELWLPYNQLSKLPVSIGNLTVLTDLWLSHNQIRELPESIGNLNALMCFRLYGNPLMFISYKILFSTNPIFTNDDMIAGCKERISMQHRIEWRYRSASPLAQLYQSTLQRPLPSDIKTQFKALPREDQGFILKLVCQCSGRPADWGEDHAFDDIDIFSRAVRDVIIAKFDELPSVRKAAIYGEVCRLANIETADLQMKELLALANLPRLADAMAERGITRKKRDYPLTQENQAL